MNETHGDKNIPRRNLTTSLSRLNGDEGNRLSSPPEVPCSRLTAISLPMWRHSVFSRLMFVMAPEFRQSSSRHA
jgi:hypothetical protein